MDSVGQRRPSIDRASVEAILAPHGDIQVPSTPVEHIGTRSNRASFPISATPTTTVGTKRPLSYAGRHGSRLSLSFPVQPSSPAYGPGKPPPTNDPPVASVPSTPSLEQLLTPSPSDPSGFLTALATQERKVLELKEELSRAEGDLGKLKRQWTMHEAHRKRTEIKQLAHSQPLQLGNTVADTVEGEVGGTVKMNAELERRKALLEMTSRDSRRRVMTGGHTRTLSLLSPDRMSHAGLFSPPLTRDPGDESGSSSDGFHQSLVMNDTSVGITKVNSNRSRHSYQGGTPNDVLKTGKKLAEDFRTGLWTFVEDLRQATVGDEAINGPRDRASTDISTTPIPKRSSRNCLDRTASIGSRKDIRRKSTEQTTPSSKRINLEPNSMDSLDDDWSNWDTPGVKSESPLWSGSTTLSDGQGQPLLGDTKESRYDITLLALF
jgi:hypothetical protein